MRKLHFSDCRLVLNRHFLVDLEAAVAEAQLADLAS